jgi:WhiB family redox-sensing transcriptional regulator
VSRYDWMEDARCAQTDPDLWHPEGSGAGYSDARKICAGCPVQQQCADFALATEGELAHNRRYGMWGAQLPRTRSKAAGGNERRRREAERRQKVFNLLERGGMDAYEIADLVGCHVRTVWRIAEAYREQMGEAA